MSQIVFMPGFDGDGALRREFTEALARLGHQVRAVTYPNRMLGTLDHYRVHAIADTPVDWNPVLVAESFSGLVAARWASIDPRVKALFLCGSFARNPVGLVASVGASWPSLVKFGQAMLPPVPTRDAKRRRWSDGFTRAITSLDDGVLGERMRLIATEDVGAQLRNLRIPVVLLQYSSDLVVGPEAQAHLETVCEKAEVLRFPGPHYSIETLPRETAAAIHQRLGKLFPAVPDPPEFS